MTRIPKDYQRVQSFADLGVKRKNFVHIIATGHGGCDCRAGQQRQKALSFRDEKRLDLKVRDIERNIVHHVHCA